MAAKNTKSKKSKKAFRKAKSTPNSHTAQAKNNEPTVIKNSVESSQESDAKADSSTKTKTAPETTIDPLADSDNLIILRGITKRYGYGDAVSYALKDFDLDIKRGEFIMIMGPSGCGKTTLLNIIGLLDRASFGSYFLNGEPVDRLSGKKKAKLRAGNIGFIFQDFNLIPTINILDNVTLPLVYTGYGKTRREKTADEILERFHLRSKEYYMPSQLSGGQKQRVAIARSLISDPEIILADEPTGNLDSRSAHIVMEELKTIHSEGNTIIMVTHNPALTVYATRVINMLDGHIDTDVKTVRDQDLPQPISVRIAKKITLKTDNLTSKIDEAANQKSQKESA